MPRIGILNLIASRRAGGVLIRRLLPADLLVHPVLVWLRVVSQEKGLFSLDVGTALFVASYKLGANAFVVKPVGFQQFVDAVNRLGNFWAIVNEPPPGSAKKTI